ncbi:pentapeptide repeat-containing protein [Sneathiella sp. HT1-7]|uniref:pentapeptide repeat-containing protein n=1 Tax=Sneathiella sp. HT1-7 TaxID=2887192 RepID=UPI001D14F71E|nr:pentapeptide repeat-containing protein [Sneathiella sp. HT1-7]MCC3305616.1 pentapeptide repeat-containing protein [Sneathiella sp. HT1-7]
MSDEKPTLLDWLHIKDGLFDKKVRWLGTPTLIALFFIAVLLLIIGAYAIVLLIGVMLNFDVTVENATSETIRNFGLVVVAFVGTPFLVWRSIVAQKQVNVAEQGQITDRINKAVEGLGSEKTIKEVIETPRYQKNNENKWKYDDEGKLIAAKRPDGTPIIDRETFERSVPNLEVRIGAIYALERIAKDSLRDHVQIMEILCAYIRENAPEKSVYEDKPLLEDDAPRADIKAAITVVGRRSKTQIALEWKKKFRLDLRNTDLSQVDFSNGNFSAAMFDQCRLTHSVFNNTKLLGTQFYRANLNYSSFIDAELRGTRFEYATIDEPSIKSARFSESINKGKFYGISVAGSNILTIPNFGSAEERALVFGTKDTELSYNFAFEYEGVNNTLPDIDEDNVYLVKAQLTEEQRNEFERLEKHRREFNFPHWPNQRSFDIGTDELHKKFLDDLGLIGWPYQNN